MDCIDKHSFVGSTADKSWYRITAGRLICSTSMVNNDIRSLGLRVGREDTAVRVRSLHLSADNS